VVIITESENICTFCPAVCMYALEFQLLSRNCFVVIFKIKSVFRWSGLLHSKFTFSPPGMGSDYYRYWEAIFHGSIPIKLIQSSTIDHLFDDLPHIFYNQLDGSDINRTELEEAYEGLRTESFRFEKLSLSYWLRYLSDSAKI